MTWAERHAESSKLASLADLAVRDGDFEKAKGLYLEAAEKEHEALREISPDKKRTFGVTTVSTVSLFYKSEDYQRAEELSHKYLADTTLPKFAKDELREILKTVWVEREFSENKIEFTKGEVLVSVSGGDVVTGGAPLELIVGKVKEISNYFYRTIEMLLDKPLRTRGNPEKDIIEQCRPWLFQAPPGSYQFAVRVQKPAQRRLFDEKMPKVEEITKKFIEIVGATSTNDIEILEQVIPDENYRNTFLKMSRNLAPTGKTFQEIEIKPSGRIDFAPVVFKPESRQDLNAAIRLKAQNVDAQDESVQLTGVLRALHLDQGWIELSVQEANEEKHVKISGTADVIDDIVGPMVNRIVIVDTIRNQKGHYLYEDIQVDE